jgi:hypothetical protein
MTDSFLNLICGLIDVVCSFSNVSWKKSSSAEPIIFKNFSIFTKAAIYCFIGFILAILTFGINDNYKTISVFIILLFFFVNFVLSVRNKNIAKPFLISLFHTIAFSAGVMLMIFACSQSIHTP